MVLLLQDSPNIGACLCLGCWLEGGKELMGADVFEAIDWFGGNNPMGQNKLFKVVSATFLLPLPGSLIGLRSLRTAFPQRVEPDAQPVAGVFARRGL